MQSGFHLQHQLMALCDFVEQSIIWCLCELCYFTQCDVMQYHNMKRRFPWYTLSVLTLQFRSHILPNCLEV